MPRRSSASAWRTARKHYPSQLSGGQQQRVAVARALVGEPARSCSPTSRPATSTPKNGEAVMELLRELHRGGATICMVTHDPRFTRHADRTIHLFDGRVVEESIGGRPSRMTPAHRAPQHREVLRSTASAAPTCCAASRSTSARASSSRSWGRRAPASRRCSTSSGMHDAAWTGEYDFLGQPVHALTQKDARRAAQAAHRLRVPELPPARRPDGRTRTSRCRSRTATSRRASAQSIVRRRARPLPDRRQEGPVPEPALRRPAAAGGRRPRRRRQARS